MSNNIKGFGNDPYLYGSSKGLLSWKGVELTKKNILQMPESQKIEISNDLFDYFRANGFPHIVYKEPILLKEWSELKSKSLELHSNNGIRGVWNKNTTGNKIIHHFNSQEFYNVKDGASSNSKTMIEAFNDDNLLKKVILNRMDVTYKEGFNIHGAMLRQGFRSSRISASTSVFNTMVAKYVYDSYTQPGDIVFDYSMGFGQRLIAALASKNNLTYVSCDPWSKVWENNKKIANFIGQEHRTDINNIGTEHYINSVHEGKISLAFSSPPYFTKEIYDTNDQTQAYSNKSYDEFVNVWWNQVVQNMSKLLKPEGILGLNTVVRLYNKHNLLDDMLDVCKKYGFVEFDRIFLLMNTNHFDKHRTGRLAKEEPIVFLRRE